MKTKKTAGILGGMGPHASIRFYEAVIQKSQEQYQVEKNHEFPHLLLSNLPVPDLIQDKNAMEQTVHMLHEEARKLEKAGADFLVLVCNTMHHFVDESAFNIPFVSMIDSVVEVVKKDGRKKVGLLASKTMTHSGMYQQQLRDRDIETLLLSESDQDELVGIILEYIANKHTSEHLKKLQTFIDSLKQAGAEAVILGCTELPLMITADISSLPVYSSSDILAERTCREIYHSKVPPT